MTDAKTGTAFYGYYEFRQFASGYMPRGYVRFVNLRPDLKSPQVWICDSCGERVTLSKQYKHVREHKV